MLGHLRMPFGMTSSNTSFLTRPWVKTDDIQLNKLKTTLSTRQPQARWVGIDVACCRKMIGWKPVNLIFGWVFLGKVLYFCFFWSNHHFIDTHPITSNRDRCGSMIKGSKQSIWVLGEERASKELMVSLGLGKRFRHNSTYLQLIRPRKSSLMDPIANCFEHKIVLARHA